MPTPVAINIYDLNDLNEYTYPFGVGIFHSGLEVHQTLHPKPYTLHSTSSGLRPRPLYLDPQA